MFPGNQTFPVTNWPRPNFVQTDLWTTTDVDLRHHHLAPPLPSLPPAQLISPQKAAQISPHKKPPRQPRKKRSKKHSHHHEREPSPEPVIEPLQEPTNKTEDNNKNNNDDNDDNDEEERLLREQLLRTLSTKRKVKPSEPERIVTIVPATSPSPPPTSAPATLIPTNANPTPIVTDKPQYSINQRYKRVKANTSSTNLAAKAETTTTTVVRTTQAIIQTRNKIVRAAPEADIDIPQSNPIIITFDEPTTDEDEQQRPPPTKQSNESTYVIADEERQAIKRLQQLQEEVIRRSNAIELATKSSVQTKPATPLVETVQESIPSTDELSALLEKRRMLLMERAKYGEIQEKMKKKKLEIGLLARDIEKLEEQLLTKKHKLQIIMH